jgi:hypothetical protein
MRKLFLLLTFCVAAQGQQAQPQACPNDLHSAGLYNYTASDTATPSAAAEVSTLQVPGSGQPSVAIRACGVSISSTVALSFTLERTGTVASTTSLTPASVNRQAPSPVVTAFKQSNVGSGTVIAAYQLAAGGTISLDLTKEMLQQGGDNVTIRTNSITGTVNINWTWFEQGR